MDHLTQVCGLFGTGMNNINDVNLIGHIRQISFMDDDRTVLACGIISGCHLRCHDANTGEE